MFTKDEVLDAITQVVSKRRSLYDPVDRPMLESCTLKGVFDALDVPFGLQKITSCSLWRIIDELYEEGKILSVCTRIECASDLIILPPNRNREG